MIKPPFSLTMTKEMSYPGRILRVLRNSSFRSARHVLATRPIHTNAHLKAAVAVGKLDAASFDPARSQSQLMPSKHIHEIAVSADGSQLSVSVNHQPLQLDSLFLRDSCMTSQFLNQKCFVPPSKLWSPIHELRRKSVLFNL